MLNARTEFVRHIARLASRVIDVVGLEHDEKGQFTGSGGAGETFGSAGITWSAGTGMRWDPDVASYEAARDAQHGELTIDQRRAVDWYSGAGYMRLNATLREGGQLDPEQARRLEDLETAFEDHGLTLTSPMTVFRGVGYSEDTREWLELEPGDLVLDDAFVSTSATAGTMGQFSDLIHVEIEVPAGAKVLLASEAEDEVLLGREAGFEVISRDSVPGNTQIRVRLVEPGEV